MKILHIASFRGNIGDNASHIGFYKILDQIVGTYTVEQLEIRKFYKNYHQADKKLFDKNFIDYLNGFDLCVFGGGGFLDYWIQNSQTGTTIDIDPDFLKDIKTPTLFTSIGCNPHQKIPNGNIEKFRNFLDKALANECIRFALRNDGSVVSIKEEIGEKYLDRMTQILDHGFFYDTDAAQFVSYDYIAINITYDQVLMESKLRDRVEIASYYKELAKVVQHCVSTLKYHIVLVPHIFSDIKAISQLLEHLDDAMIRNHISVAPCIQGNEGANTVFSIYKGSKLVIATRFHANVCSMAMGIPTIGLAILDRVQYLYDYLNVSSQSITIRHHFSQDIIALLSSREFGHLSLDKSLLNDLKMKTIGFYGQIFRHLPCSQRRTL